MCSGIRCVHEFCLGIRESVIEFMASDYQADATPMASWSRQLNITTKVF